MFTQVGVVVLVVTYMIIGALIFEHLEGESQMEVAVEALEVRKTFTFWILHIFQPVSFFSSFVLNPGLSIQAYMIKNFGQLYSAEIGLITNDADILLLTEIFPKLQWECGCGLGVRKCIGAIHRKIHEIFLHPISRSCFTPGITWIGSCHDYRSKQIQLLRKPV